MLSTLRFTHDSVVAVCKLYIAGRRPVVGTGRRLPRAHDPSSSTPRSLAAHRAPSRRSSVFDHRASPPPHPSPCTNEPLWQRKMSSIYSAVSACAFCDGGSHA